MQYFFRYIYIFILFHYNRSSAIHHPKCEKKLFLYLTINALDIYETLLYFLISLKTTNISESFSVCMLVDSRAMEIFINIKIRDNKLYSFYFLFLIFSIWTWLRSSDIMLHMTVTSVTNLSHISQS